MIGLTELSRYGQRLLIILAIGTWACAPTISVYDQHAYESATSLKAEALSLMNNATESFATHKDRVQGLMMRVEAAYEYAKGLPRNAISARQWEILKDPDGRLLGGFMALWEAQGTVRQAGIDANRPNVRDAFAIIIELEAAKIRE